MGEDQILAIAEKAAEQAIIKYEASLLDKEKAKQDARLHNTKLLLKNYKRLQRYCSQHSENLDMSDVQDATQYLRTSKIDVESLTSTAKRTIAIMSFVDKAIASYKDMATLNETSECARRYQTIYHMYIAEERLNTEDISKKHGVVKRTVQLDIQDGISDLSVYLFGFDALRIK